MTYNPLSLKDKTIKQISKVFPDFENRGNLLCEMNSFTKVVFAGTAGFYDPGEPPAYSLAHQESLLPQLFGSGLVGSIIAKEKPSPSVLSYQLSS